jgi:hypothetical protein
MLISEIISEVIDEVGGDSSDTGLATKLLTCAKGALRRFPLYCRDRLLYATSYATLSAGENTLSVPTYFLAGKGAKCVWYEESGRRNIIHKLTDEKFPEYYNSEATGVPQYYHIEVNTIEFDVKSDVDRTIYVQHLCEVDDVTAASDFFGSSDMIEILKDGIKATYYTDYTEDTTGRGDKKASMFKDGLDKLNSRAMIESLGTHAGD